MYELLTEWIVSCWRWWCQVGSSQSCQVWESWTNRIIKWQKKSWLYAINIAIQHNMVCITDEKMTCHIAVGTTHIHSTVKYESTLETSHDSSSQSAFWFSIFSKLCVIWSSVISSDAISLICLIVCSIESIPLVSPTSAWSTVALSSYRQTDTWNQLQTYWQSNVTLQTRTLATTNGLLVCRYSRF